MRYRTSKANLRGRLRQVVNNTLYHAQPAPSPSITKPPSACPRACSCWGPVESDGGV